MSHNTQNFEPQFQIDFSRLITLLIFVLLVTMFMCSCSPNHHLKKASKHIALAKAKGAKVSKDTIYKTVTIVVPEVRIDTVFRKVNFTDTLIFEKDKVITRVKVDTVNNTVFVDTKCPEIIVTKEIEIPCEQISTGMGTWNIILIALGCFGVGFLVHFITRRK
jgi:hypothetical protein